LFLLSVVLVDVKEVARGEVEGLGVEVDHGGELGGADAVVAQLRSVSVAGDSS
jgi:hypothetical protein